MSYPNSRARSECPLPSFSGVKYTPSILPSISTSPPAVSRLDIWISLPSTVSIPREVLSTAPSPSKLSTSFTSSRYSRERSVSTSFFWFGVMMSSKNIDALDYMPLRAKICVTVKRSRTSVCVSKPCAEQRLPCRYAPRNDAVRRNVE